MFIPCFLRDEANQNVVHGARNIFSSRVTASVESIDTDFLQQLAMRFAKRKFVLFSQRRQLQNNE